MNLYAEEFLVGHYCILHRGKSDLCTIGMVEHVLQGDHLTQVGQFGDMFPHIVVQGQLSLLLQHVQCPERAAELGIHDAELIEMYRLKTGALIATPPGGRSPRSAASPRATRPRFES